MNACQKVFSHFLTLDTETTGFSQDDEILSCSLIDQDGNVVLDTLVKPIYTKTWPYAEAVHGITPEMVFKDGISYTALLLQVKEIIDEHEFVIIYNAKFDTKFFPHHFFDNQRVLCAMESSLAFLNNHPSYTAPSRYLKQAVLAELLEVKTHDIKLHESKSDAELCRRIWLKMMEESPKLDIPLNEILGLT